MAASQTQPRIAVLSRGDPLAPTSAATSRFNRVFEALHDVGAAAEPVVFDEAIAEPVRDRLAQFDGVLVWVDPLDDGRDRSVLDPLLRDVSAQGVWVSAHPDVILKMGTKDVLYRTRGLPWGTDTRLYPTVAAFHEQFPPLLAAGPRVLKQHRGNGGNGVWKVEIDQHVDEATVLVLHALRGSSVEVLPLDVFMDRCTAYFAGSGCLVDQPFQARLGDGMIRCYFVHDRVVGFGHQFVTALLAPPSGEAAPPTPPPRRYYGPSKPGFQALRTQLETGAVAEMQRVLDIDTASLPAIWDADFLYGARTAAGEDTYVLCEINVSSVFPIPGEALRPLAAAAVAHVLAAKALRPR